MVELFLHSIMAPSVLAKICQLNQTGNFDLKNSIVAPTCAGVIIALLISTLRSMETLSPLRKVDLPVHDWSSSYSSSIELQHQGSQ